MPHANPQIDTVTAGKVRFRMKTGQADLCLTSNTSLFGRVCMFSYFLSLIRIRGKPQEERDNKLRR